MQLVHKNVLRKTKLANITYAAIVIHEVSTYFVCDPKLYLSRVVQKFCSTSTDHKVFLVFISFHSEILVKCLLKIRIKNTFFDFVIRIHSKVMSFLKLLINIKFQNLED